MGQGRGRVLTEGEFCIFSSLGRCLGRREVLLFPSAPHPGLLCEEINNRGAVSWERVGNKGGKISLYLYLSCLQARKREWGQRENLLLSLQVTFEQPLVPGVGRALLGCFPHH